MKNKSYIILKVLFSGFMLFSALGELTLNETVVQSMAYIEMPVYLLYFLGVSKLLGIIALWYSPYKFLREWAYAGFTFDFLGAIYGFIATGHLVLPDIVMASTGLLLCILTYYYWKKSNVLVERIGTIITTCFGGNQCSIQFRIFKNKSILMRN